MFKKFIIVALFAIISLTSVATTYAVGTTTPTATITSSPLTVTVNGALLLSGTASNMDRLYITTTHPGGSSQTSGITFTNGVWYQNYPTGYFTQAGNYVVTLRANSETNTVLYTGTIVVTAPEVPIVAIASYDFDKGTGTVLTDQSGNSRDGVFVGTPTWTTGKYGKALSFNNKDNVNLRSVLPIQGVQKLTISAWMKRAELNSKVLIGKQNSASKDTVAIELWDDGKVHFGISSSLTYAGGSVEFNDTNWHYVTLVFDGTQSGNANRLKGYIDGVQQSLTYKGTVPSVTTKKTTPFGIGYVNGSYSDGLIDNVRVYTQALSKTNVLTDMNTPVNGTAIPTATITTSPLTTPVNTAFVLSGTASNMDRIYVTTSNPDGTEKGTSGIIPTNGFWGQNYPTGYFTQAGNYVVTLRANSATNTVLYTATIVVTATGSTIASIPSAHTLASRSLVQTTSGGALTARLTKGVQGNQVSTLQKFLINDGYLKENTPTAYFGPLTEDALKRFQCEKLEVCDGTPDTTGYGAVGPRTRTMINGLIGG